MALKTILIKISGAVVAILSAIFYVLFMQKKMEDLQERNLKLEEEKAKAEASIDIEEKVNKKLNDEKKDNEELYQEAIAGDSISNFDAGIKFLHNLQEKSKSRNSNT